MEKEIKEVLKHIEKAERLLKGEAVVIRDRMQKVDHSSTQDYRYIEVV